MVLLGLFDILGVLLFDINLSNFGERSRDVCGFSLVNCLHGLLIALYEILLDILQLLNQGGQVVKDGLISLFCGGAEILSFRLRGSLNGCAGVKGLLVGEVCLRVVQVELR